MKKKKAHSIPQSSGENTSRFEYHPYVQATAFHQSLPRHGSYMAGVNGMNSLNSSKVSTPSTPAMNNNKVGGANLPPSMRRSSLSLNKGAQSFIPGNTSSPAASNIYSQGVANENYQYHGSSDDLYGQSLSHSAYTTSAENSGSKNYDPYNSMYNTVPSHTFSPSPSVSQRNSINLGPSYGEDYGAHIGNVASGESTYGNAYLSQLRAESIEAQQSNHPAISSGAGGGGFYQHDLVGNRNSLGMNTDGISSAYRNSSPYSGSGNYPSNYSVQQRSSGVMNNVNEQHMNSRSFSINASNSHLASAVVGGGGGRGQSSRQGGNYSAVSNLLFNDSGSGLNTSGQYSAAKEGPSTSVLSNLFPSLLQPSDPPAPTTPTFVSQLTSKEKPNEADNFRGSGFKFY